jgi:hypothetical protein
MEGSPALLVADEFHFLTPAHKRELLSWVELRVAWLKCILVANRHTAFDTDLLRDVNGRLDPNVVSIPPPIMCRLSIQRVLEVARAEVADFSHQRETFFRRWFGATRSLCGDEAVSLRFIGSLLKINSSEGLRELLLEKMPSISQLTVHEFANYLWEGRNRTDAVEVDLSGGALRCLIQVALQDQKLERVTFPQFSADLKFSAFEYHPVARLVAWALLVHPPLQLKAAELTRCFSALCVVDQPGLPFIQAGTSQNVDLQTCMGYAKRGDYRDLAWMASTISQGHALDWSAVKKTWKTSFVSDVRALSAVICATAEKAACIKALDPDNICSLLEDPWDNYLAKTCVEALSGDDNLPSVPKSAFWTACWALFRFNPSCYSDLRSKIDEGKMLRWVSVNGYGLRGCATKSEQMVNDRLMALLRAVSLQRLDDADFLHALWGNQFAEYLVESQVDGVVKLKLASTASNYGYKSNWPRLMHLLCKVYAGDAIFADCEELLDDRHAEFFASLPYRVMDQLFVERLCRLVDGKDPPLKFQEFVLTSPVKLDWGDDDVSYYLEKLADGIKHVSPERIMVDSAVLRRELRARGVGVELSMPRAIISSNAPAFSLDEVFSQSPGSPSVGTPAQPAHTVSAFQWFREVQKKTVEGSVASRQEQLFHSLPQRMKPLPPSPNIRSEAKRAEAQLLDFAGSGMSGGNEVARAENPRPGDEDAAKKKADDFVAMMERIDVGEDDEEDEEEYDEEDNWM